MAYIPKAIARAGRRKSLWNLALLPAVLLPLLALVTLFVLSAQVLHSSMYPGENFRNAVGFWPGLVLISALSGALAPAMLMGNGMLWLLPWTRNAFDREAKGHPGTSFHETTRSLLRVARFAVPSALMGMIVGVCFSWR